MTMLKSWYGAVLCVAILAVAQPVVAQDTNTRALMDRIERLERDIRTLNVQIARGSAGAAAVTQSGEPSAGGADPAYARLNVRVSQIENDLRGVTGRLEEITYKIDQVSQQMSKLVTDMEFRLGRLEQGDAGAASGSMRQPTPGANILMGQDSSNTPSTPNTIAPSPMPADVAEAAQPPRRASSGSQVLGTLNENDLGKANPSAAPAGEPKSEADALLAQLTGETPKPAASVPAPASAAPANETAALSNGTPRDQYMQAFGLLRQGKYDQASASLRKFLEQNPSDKLASNARYWLGETYYVRGSFVEAAETFLEGYQADPQGPKAPDALLKLGMSLSSLEKKTEACAAFQKLRSDYPDAPAGLKSTLQREWQKNGCV
ncbi:MAG: tol-pal system protein YbgF [Rhodospirillales bacterium]